MVTDAELEGIAAQALNMAKRDIEHHGFNFLLASYHEGETLHRMTTVEKLIVERLGEAWLNSGRTKDLGFHMLRIATTLLPPDAIVFVTAANRFKPTEKFNALPNAQKFEIAKAGHDRHHQAVKEGLFVLVDALFAIAQTPERVCNYIQDFEGGRPLDNPETKFYPQQGFSGRLKMYADENEGQRRHEPT